MDLATRVGACLSHADANVRAAAVEAVGRLVANPAVLAAIAASSAPHNVDTVIKVSFWRWAILLYVTRRGAFCFLHRKL